MAHLPSFKGLQALEAASRTGSFAAAARELSVSPAAVSQLVRALEDQVGRKLFYRVNRGVTPTEAGLEILPRLTLAFEELKEISTRISGTARRSRLIISAPPSVASGWLSARIADFVATHGSVDIFLREDNDPVDFERDRIDIRFSYGRFHYQTHATEEIATDVVIPVCSPGFLASHGPLLQASDLVSVPLVHTDWGPAAATFPAWRNWFQAMGVEPDASVGRGLVANSSVAAVNLAIAGLGVVLCQGLLAAQYVSEGRLALACRMSLVQSQPYCLTVPQRSAARPVVEKFRNWLVQNCSETVKSQMDIGIPVLGERGV
ncbi:MAG: LysR family transcriptional regulator [Rhodobacteraceae bacterium]|nr:LysR family transcriptional regulator [Paracoccaceae bacterium]